MVGILCNMWFGTVTGTIGFGFKKKSSVLASTAAQWNPIPVVSATSLIKIISQFAAAAALQAHILLFFELPLALYMHNHF